MEFTTNGYLLMMDSILSLEENIHKTYDYNLSEHLIIEKKLRVHGYSSLKEDEIHWQFNDKGLLVSSSHISFRETDTLFTQCSYFYNDRDECVEIRYKDGGGELRVLVSRINNNGTIVYQANVRGFTLTIEKDEHGNILKEFVDDDCKTEFMYDSDGILRSEIHRSNLYYDCMNPNSIKSESDHHNSSVIAYQIDYSYNNKGMLILEKGSALEPSTDAEWLNSQSTHDYYENGLRRTTTRNYRLEKKNRRIQLLLKYKFE